MPSAIRIAVVVAALLPAAAFAAGNERIPTDNWSYAAVERFESLGYCTLPDARPYSRKEFTRIVRSIHDAIPGKRPSARDRYELDRLDREYAPVPAVGPAYDRVWRSRDGAVIVDGDLGVRPYLEQRPGSSEVETYVGLDPEVRVHIGDRVTYDVRYRILFGPEHGDRRGGSKPSRRETSFHGLTALFDRSYVNAIWDRVEVLVGRDYVDWGPARNAGLITPGARYGIDQIGARVFFRSLRLDAFYGQLFPDPERYLVGHRLEGRWGRTVVGLSETVTYGGRGVDMVYLLPIAWYYANQYNERTNEDNILWSIDAKTSFFDRLTVYGNLLIDDFQFERGSGYPDKLAADVGARWIPDRPLGLAVSGSYRWVDVYTYSHFDSLSVYASGAGELSGGDVLLGGEPGPDSDVWRAAAEVFPRANLRVTLGAFGSRVGERNDLRPFDIETDQRDPPFPSGVVERTLGFDISARWEFDGDSWISLLYTHASVDNVAHVAGSDDGRDGFRLEVRWDVP